MFSLQKNPHIPQIMISFISIPFRAAGVFRGPVDQEQPTHPMRFVSLFPRVAVTTCLACLATFSVEASEFMQDFEMEESIPAGWNLRTESGAFEIQEGCASSRAAQVTGKDVELSYYAKEGVWTSLDGAGDFQISFSMKSGVSWRLVLAGQDSRGFVVYVEGSKISVSAGGNNWWEARMQPFPIPDISGKWMTLRLSQLTLPQKSSGDPVVARMSLFEAENPANKLVEDLHVVAAGPETGAPFQRITEMKIFEWSSGGGDCTLRLDNISMQPSRQE